MNCRTARLKMLSPSWLLLAVIAHVSHTSRGSKCWDSSVCANLSNKQRILECIQVCMAEMQNETPQSTEVNDVEVPLGLMQNDVTSEERSLKGTGQSSHSNERRSYSMEHFRWGKPSGRKRRPVKVFASSLEGGGSPEAPLPLQARRRQLRTYEKRNGGAQQGQRSKPAYAYNKQERKDGTYRMSHFRWGSPPASKRNGLFLQQWQDKPQSPLTSLLRNLMGKDVERIVG